MGFQTLYISNVIPKVSTINKEGITEKICSQEANFTPFIPIINL
jgi:hypothetical protein